MGLQVFETSEFCIIAQHLQHLYLSEFNCLTKLDAANIDTIFG